MRLNGKKFKDYERMWPQLVGSATLNDLESEMASKINRWPKHMYFEQHSQAAILHAVYDAPDHENWQKLRISLKKLPTRHKLYRLEEMWNKASRLEPHIFTLYRIRINNYLNALVRGGQLNQRLEVVR